MSDTTVERDLKLEDVIDTKAIQRRFFTTSVLLFFTFFVIFFIISKNFSFIFDGLIPSFVLTSVFFVFGSSAYLQWQISKLDDQIRARLQISKSDLRGRFNSHKFDSEKHSYSLGPLSLDARWNASRQAISRGSKLD